MAGVDHFTAAMGFGRTEITPTEAVLADICFINALLLAFNLLPGLPLDGGRIVRAIAWWRTGDRAKATRIMATTGKGLALILAGLGLYELSLGGTFGGVWSLLIALLIW